MTQPEKMELTSMNVAAQKREELKQALGNAFPDVFAEGAIDFDQLKRVLGEWVDPSKERFGLNWAGKSQCMRVIQQASTATLKPMREVSLDFDEAENVFIEGDNLEVLKLIQKSYFGSIKAIYIDPPYNTGKEFIYPDRYAETLDTYLNYTNQIDENRNRFSTNTDSSGRFHSSWLNMMYARLYLARNLLRDDGVLMISIDENEFHNLKKLSDEIFGEENYAGEIVWKNSSKNDQSYISIQHEYILFYCKNKDANNGDWVEKKEGLDDIYRAFDGFRARHGNDWDAIHSSALEWYKQFSESNPISSSKHYNWMDETGVYFPDNISGPNYGQYRYDVRHPVTGEVCKEPASGWRYPEDTMKQRIRDNLVHFGKDHTTVPCNKTYLKTTEFQSLTSVKVRDGRAASKRLQALFGENVFTNPKDEQFLKELFKVIGVSGSDIVLDFFAGSGTTFQSVIELNKDQSSQCRSILVQLPEDIKNMRDTAAGSAKKVATNAIDYLEERGLPTTISALARERLRLCCEAINNSSNGELALHKAQSRRNGFKSFRLDTSNFAIWDGSKESFDETGTQLDLHVDHIREASNSEDILYELLLKAGFALTTKVAGLEVAGTNVFSVEDGALLICLEKEITPELIDALADANPLQVICLDAGFKGNDQLKANAVQTFKARAQAEESEIVFRTV